MDVLYKVPHPPPDISSTHLSPARVVTLFAFENPFLAPALLHPGPQLPRGRGPGREAAHSQQTSGEVGVGGQKVCTSRIKYVRGV